MKNQSFRILLKNPNFVRLWSSQLLSQLTVNIVNFLMLTRVYAATQSTIAVSLIWVAWSLPALLFGPFSGAIVDSSSRRRMMVVTNLLQSATIASYFLLKDHVFALYFVVFTYSLFDQLYIPSQQASLPAIAGKKLLTAANGIFLLTQQASFLVGMGLGGIFLGLFGPTVAIFLASIALIAAAVAVYFLPHDAPNRSAWEKDLSQFWHDFRQGFTFVKNQKIVLFPLTLIVCLQIFVTIVAVILPSYTKNVLRIDLNHAGLAFIIPGSIGALALTYFLPQLLNKYRKKILVQSGLCLAALSLLALALVPFFTTGRLLVSVIISLGLGMSLAAIMIPSQTLLQEKTPPWLRGRVYGSLGFLMTVATSLPLIAAAAITDLLGTSALLALMAIMLFFGFLFISRKGDHVLANGFRV